MSVTIKVLSGRTASALQRYRDSLADGQEPPLLITSRHCSTDLPTQIGEWRALRQMHGTDGAVRSARASYETVDPETGLHASGERGTHVKEWRGGRLRPRPVREGETPTHLRVEAESLTSVKQSEAMHTIYAAGPDLIHPGDMDGINRFFDAVVAEREEHYAGLQESIWLERNGTSGLVHVHVASNATVYSDFTLDVCDYRAGQKISGGISEVHAVRERFERYLDEHPEYGLRQELPRVGSEEYLSAQRRSSQRDYHERRRGQESGSDRLRRLAVEALTADGVTDRAGYIDALAERGVEVTETGLRRGKPGKNHDFVYRLTEGEAAMKRGVTGKALGDAYRVGTVDEQLQRKARGLEVELPQPRTAGTAQQIETSREAIDEQVAQLAPLAAEGQAAQIASVWDEALEEDARRERERLEARRAQQADSSAEPIEDLLRAIEDGTLAAETDDLADAAVAEEVRLLSRLNGRRAEGTAPAPESWHSALRERTPQNPRKAEVVAALAAFEEDHARDALARGERLDEAKVPSGVGPAILAEFGPAMDPAVRRQLTLRAEKREARAAVFEERRTAARERFRLEQARDPRAGDAMTRVEQLGSTITRMETEIKQGIYEMDTPGARAEQQERQVQRVERERELTRTAEELSPFAAALKLMTTPAGPACPATPVRGATAAVADRKVRLRAIEAEQRKARRREREADQDHGMEM